MISACLIAVVLLTSKYDIKVIKENGKLRDCGSTSLFYFFVCQNENVVCGSWRNESADNDSFTFHILAHV